MSNSIEDHPLVSVILPVYNGEPFLPAAITSVIVQSYSNWELIIIDDGSNDRSASICDSYLSKDLRIKVFHQSNKGVNSARAKGVDEAKGEYFVFLDADDTFSPDSLDYMLANFTDEYDLLVCGYYGLGITKEEYLQQLWSGVISPALWGKMFRASSFRQMDYNLDPRLVMGEDILLNSVYALYIEKVMILPKAVYRVNHGNESSVTRTFKHNWEYETLYFSKVQELFLDKCSEWDSYERIKLLVNKSWLNAMKYVMLDGGGINYQDQEFQEIKGYFADHKDALGPSEKLIFKVKSPALYRMILKTYIRLKGKKK